MQMPSPKLHYGVFLIIIPLIFAFSMAYYNSAKSTVKPYQIFRDKVRNQFSLYGRVTQPKLPAGQILLKKSEKIQIQKSSVIYKGLSNGTIYLDLYLMDFDPDMPYTKRFTKQDIQNGVWLGDVLCQALEIKKDRLLLKIIRVRTAG